MTAGIIWGLQALAGVAICCAAYRDRARKESAAAAENAAAEKEEGRGVLRAILGDAYRKAKGRGALRGGYGPSLGITALSECIRRVDAGEDVEAGVIVEALELLGLHLERDEAGSVVVCEN